MTSLNIKKTAREGLLAGYKEINRINCARGEIEFSRGKEKFLLLKNLLAGVFVREIKILKLEKKCG